MGMLNPLRDKNGGMFLPGGGRKDTWDHGFCPQSWKVKVMGKK